jgi:hypothetical protein
LVELGPKLKGGGPDKQEKAFWLDNVKRVGQTTENPREEELKHEAAHIYQIDPEQITAKTTAKGEIRIWLNEGYTTRWE